MIVAPDAQHHRREFMSVLVHAFVYAPECGIYDRHVEDPGLPGGVNLSALSSRPKGLWGESPLYKVLAEDKSKMPSVSIVGDIKMDFPNKQLFKTANGKGVP